MNIFLEISKTQKVLKLCGHRFVSLASCTIVCTITRRVESNGWQACTTIESVEYLVMIWEWGKRTKPSHLLVDAYMLGDIKKEDEAADAVDLGAEGGNGEAAGDERKGVQSEPPSLQR